MNIHRNTSIIDLRELVQISKGDKRVLLKYLVQFQDLIPQRIDSLEVYLKAGDRKQVRQLLHQMSPQLQFFGIKDIVQPIRRLEHEYKTMPYKELSFLVNNIVIKLNLAIKDVNSVIKENF